MVLFEKEFRVSFQNHECPAVGGFMSRPYHDLAWKLFSLIFVLLAGLTVSSAGPALQTETTGKNATQQEGSRTTAEKLVAEAETLTEKRTETSYQQAIEKYL